MENSFSIRPARIGDEIHVVRLIRELADYEKLLHECVVSEEQIGHALFSENPKVFSEIVECNGSVVGFCLYFFNFSTFLGRPGIYLEDLYVQPEYRNLGIGKSLMRTLARKAVQEGCGRFEWSVLDWNEPSIAFYRKIGAIGMEEWTVQRLEGEALVKLSKEVD